MGRARRVLILYSVAGRGHLVAAQAIKEELEELAGTDQIDVRLSEPATARSVAPRRMVQVYDWMRAHAPGLYAYYARLLDAFEPYDSPLLLERSRAYLEGLFRETEPDLVLSVHPMCNHAPVRVLKDLGMRGHVKFAVFVTDPLGSILRGWASPEADRVYVCTERCRDALLSHGLVDNGQIALTRFPLRRGFRAGTSAEDSVTLVPRVLVTLPSGSRRRARQLARQLGKIEGFDFTLLREVAPGERNAEWARRDAFNNVELIGERSGDEMVELMRSSDYYFGKFDAATFYEALAARTVPIVDTSRAVMPQERDIVDLIVEQAIGAQCSADHLADTLARLQAARRGLRSSLEAERSAAALAPSVARSVLDLLGSPMEQRPPVSALSVARASSLPLRKLATPYSRLETTRSMFRASFGVSESTHGTPLEWLSPCSRAFPSRARNTVAFVGDLMQLFGRRLVIDSDVAGYLGACDHICLNLEGIVTNAARPKGVWLGREQRHLEATLDVLAASFEPSKLCVSVANNHSGDFGRAAFERSVAVLESYGFRVFGTLDKPFVDVEGGLRIVTGTAWSNQNCNYVPTLRQVAGHRRPGACNVLFPHWGHEFELHPRPSVVRAGDELLRAFDAVLGHHAHCPQPITVRLIENRRKLVAYSLGNLCSGRERAAFAYGLAVRCAVVAPEQPNAPGNIEQIDWTYVKTHLTSPGIAEVSLAKRVPWRCCPTISPAAMAALTKEVPAWAAQ